MESLSSKWKLSKPFLYGFLLVFIAQSLIVKVNDNQLSDHFHIESNRFNSHEDHLPPVSDVNHQHEHRHSPEGPLHDHSHQHGPQSQSDTKIFQAVKSFDFKRPTYFCENFDKSDSPIAQGFLLEIFRPPIV
ncbi:hypothetical protein GW915_08305 [bacterium]|nr:hypothetical protein [bacterium]